MRSMHPIHPICPMRIIQGVFVDMTEGVREDMEISALEVDRGGR